MSKCAIVTGGVRGIGKGIALSLAKQGYEIVATYVGAFSDGQANELKAEFKELGRDICIIESDVRDMQSCEDVVKQAQETFDDIEILVNNAGITKDNLLLKMSEEDFKLVLDINLTGAFNMIKAVQRKMIKQKYGRIINISSVIGEIGNVGQANYAASKAGLIGLSKSVARELATRNITVNCVAPGFIATDMTDVLDEKVVDEIKRNIPSKKLGSIDDVVNAVAFLASKESLYITGQVLNVCGGMVM